MSQNEDLPSKQPSGPEGTEGRLWVHRNLRSIIYLVVAAAFFTIGMCNLMRQRGDEVLDPERPKPEEIARDPKLRAFLEERFEIVSGNAPVDEARAIGWGEMHFIVNRKDRKKIAEDVRRAGFLSMNNISSGLEAVVKDGDHILLEGISPERGSMRVNPLLHFSLIKIRNRAVLASGWDDEKLLTNLDTPIDVTKKKAMERNETALIPSVLKAVREKAGRVHTIAGMGHFIDDPRIDRALEEQDILYILLAEREGLGMLRSLLR